MSIWTTLLDLDDDHTDDCNVVVHHGSSVIQVDRTRSCTCGQPDTPYLYQQSHILPTPEDPKGGMVSVAEIPPWITRDGRDDAPEDGRPWPWLRLSVGQDDAVIGEQQALQLRDALTGWLDRRQYTEESP